MFKWPGTPSPRASQNELADYAELLCLQHGSTSTTTVTADLIRLEDNDYYDGVPEEDAVDQNVAEAYGEVERRRIASRGGYPFVVRPQGYTLSMDTANQDHRCVVYRYLLLATRLNMRDSRVHAGIDGTLLLEHLAAEVAREYLGDRAESLVFGTGAGETNFEQKVDDLCRRLGEGGGFQGQGGGATTSIDGKLDVVAWKPFTDKLPGKIIGFGQCKTGTAYKDELTQLQPDSFLRKWLRPPHPIPTPVRMFFVSESLPECGWYDMASDAGLLFDRCRIVDFCAGISDELLGRIQEWTEAASGATGLAIQ